MATTPKKKEVEVEAAPVVTSAHEQYLTSLLGEKYEAPVRFPSSGPEALTSPTKEGYIGVDPIYQNHANDTEKPYASEGGGDKLAEEAYREAVEGKPKKAGEQLAAAHAEVTKNSP